MSPEVPGYHSPVVLRLEAARRLGCEVVELDPETGYLHEIRRQGRSRVLVGALSPLNDAAAARLANDKFHTATVLAHHGFRVPRGIRCLRPGRFDRFAAHTGLGPAHAFAQAHGFPVVVKPNAGSRGRGVQVVHDRPALEAAIEAIWPDDYLVLVQQPVEGSDLRIDLLDGRCIFAYERRPLALVGDGQATIQQLLARIDPRFSPQWCRELLPGDPVWQRTAVAQGLGVDSVLAAGEPLRFDSIILNLNRLCVGEVLDPLPEPWLALALEVARRMGLRHLGIDLKIRTLAQDPGEAVVVEVNASPSLANMAMAGHYEQVMAVEAEIVEAVLAASSSRA